MHPTDIVNIGDEVTVKSGYARNFLVPNKKALYATTENTHYSRILSSCPQKMALISDKSASSIFTLYLILYLILY